MSRLVLATHNAEKLVELRRIVTPLTSGVDVVGLGDGGPGDVNQGGGGGGDARDGGRYAAPPETEASFAANALLKARAALAATGLPCLADDSGLCVDALNGMPGVLSARWSGRAGDDAANNALLLGQLGDVPADRRDAHFVCVVALVLPDGREFVEEGVVHGRLLTAPRGSGGFGYDPLFVPEGGAATTAELAVADKDALSHRGRALRAIAPLVARVLATDAAGAGEGT